MLGSDKGEEYHAKSVVSLLYDSDSDLCVHSTRQRRIRQLHASFVLNSGLFPEHMLDRRLYRKDVELACHLARRVARDCEHQRLRWLFRGTGMLAGISHPLWEFRRNLAATCHQQGAYTGQLPTKRRAVSLRGAPYLCRHIGWWN
jgi:hypothetical protein